MPEEIPSHPDSANPASANPGSATRFRATVAALLAIGAGAAGYAVHERNVAQQMADQNSAVTSTLNTTRDQMSALNTRLDAITTERAAEKEKAAAANPAGVGYRKPVTAASLRRRMDDPRWKKVQGQLDDQAKQIDSTRQDLASARTELQGSIATTHDELVLLEKKGERSYFEFDLDKRAQMQREGPVAVRLRKANTKREYADLELMVDDFKVSKNHVNIYEPVVFYAADRKVPVELVINSIAKNHIHGYVSEPKYKGAELEAMATTSASSQSSSGQSSSQSSNGQSSSQSTSSAASNSSGTQTAPAEKPSATRQQLQPPNN
jgi:hypothetical protein